MKLLPLILLAGCVAAPLRPPPMLSPMSSVQPEAVSSSVRLVNTGGASWAVVYPSTINPARFNWKVLTKSDLTQSRWTEEPSETDSDAMLVHTNGRPNLFIRIVGEPKS